MNKFIYQKDYPVVQTKEGALRGYEWKGTCIFKGIPYAHAQRFRKPERVKPWDGVKDVQSYGYVSPLLHPEQPGGNGEMMVPHMYWSEKEGFPELKYLDAVHSGWQETSGYGMAARRRIFSGVFHRTARL